MSEITSNKDINNNNPSSNVNNYQSSNENANEVSSNLNNPSGDNKDLSERLQNIVNKVASRQTTRPNMPNLDDNKITRDELRSILKAMDKDGFEKIMEDYMKEISDPNNITETNQYLRECMERKDLPANVKLVQPKEGFVIKSTKYNIKKPGLRQKVFINIVGLNEIAAPQIDPKSGMCSLPHLLNKQRNDQDKKGKICYTFDVAFNPEALKRAEENMGFKKFICDTAINGINNNILKQAQEKISNDYILKIQLKYKGKEMALMNINSASTDKNELKSQLEPNENYKTQIQKEIDEVKNRNNGKEAESHIEADSDNVFDKPDVDYKLAQNEVKIANNIHSLLEEEKAEKEAKPEYKIKYSDDVQLHKYFYNPNNYVSGQQYSKLIIDISVPKLINLNHAEVELDEKKLHFKYKDIYLLDLDLPVMVDKNTSNAKFDRHKQLLSISALILRKNNQELKLKEDENIEIIKSDDEEANEQGNKKTLEPSSEKNQNNCLNTSELNQTNRKESDKSNKAYNEIETKQEKAINEVDKSKQNASDLQKLEFDKKLKEPINLEMNIEQKVEGINESDKNTINKEAQEEKVSKKLELVKEVQKASDTNDEDDIEAGVHYKDKNITNEDGFKDRAKENTGDQAFQKDNNAPTKKTFNRKEISQLAFLNYNCPWIYELD